MGHADDKKKEQPESITPIEHTNIGCDDNINSCDLPGYKAMLQIDSKLITTNFGGISVIQKLHLL